MEEKQMRKYEMSMKKLQQPDKEKSRVHGRRWWEIKTNCWLKVNDQWVDAEGCNGPVKYQCTFETKWRRIALNLMSLSFVVRTRGISCQPGSERVKEGERKKKEREKIRQPREDRRKQKWEHKQRRSWIKCGTGSFYNRTYIIKETINIVERRRHYLFYCLHQGGWTDTRYWFYSHTCMTAHNSTNIQGSSRFDEYGPNLHTEGK